MTNNLVNHTHWDREWYFTTTDALVLSDQLFTEALDELEKNKDANFCLDGQTSIVDEYVEIHPEAEDRIKKLVAEGRLFVGPWYTQTDALVPDAESIIRNLVIGINDTKQKYGKPMMVGYLPDTFGFNAQLPTLLHQVGIDNFIFWRGTNFDRQMKSVYFKWKGLSGKEVYAANFPFGYFTAQIDVESKRRLPQFVKERFDPASKFSTEHGDNQELLMPSGIDQMNIVKNMGETVKKLNDLSNYNTVISSYPEFIGKLRKQKDLPSYQGELRLPTYSRVHRTIGSVRHNIKTDNFNLEQKILRRIEPLTVIAKKCDIDIGNGLMIKLWKKLLECQAHDTLGGSVSDNVAVDIEHRFKEANEMADGIENMIEKKIADYLNLSDHDVLIFNTDAHEYVGPKTISIVASSKKIKFDGLSDAYITDSKHFPTRHHILMMTPKGQEYTDEPEYYQLTFKGNVELPALGYKVIHFEDSEEFCPEAVKTPVVGNNKISFGDKFIEFVDGQINYGVGNNTKVNILELVDSGNDGDTYDYSPLSGDKEISLPLNNSYVEKVNGVAKKLVVIGSASLPLRLDDRLSLNPDNKLVAYKLELEFNDHDMVNATLKFDNVIESHRLRLRFNSNIDSDEAIAHIQDGFVKTNNKPIADNWNDEFVEKPVNIYDFDKNVSVGDKDSHFTFFGKGMKEYQYNETGLYITLMATTGQLGKPNLAWRPGRASGDTTNQGHIMMPTPLAQELGENVFKFAFKFENEAFSESKAIKETRSWLTPSISYQTQKLNMFIHRLDNKIWETENNPKLDDTISLLDLDDNLDVSAIYRAYSDTNSYIVRIQNPTSERINLSKELIDKSSTVDALENPISDVDSIDPYNMVTLKLKL
ncbi:alpha-mannosidase [Companilactobacillus hulinensis]|uniref:alpha-mannosidase n=1 Tax=Companilactobacillus hulinensis TaxID=2486007 RepID=UPI000F7963AE|nr:glycoside hydrolase family 38 C-terminal domain-containing protein [Companilactobacillus hulinensis]